MGVFEMVVALVLIGTAGRVAQAFAKRPKPGDGEGRMRALEATLQASELRLAQAEERMAELGDKVGFLEALLDRPDRHAPLPPPPA